MTQFRAATLKLTGWYLAILMVVSLTLSVAIFQISAHEFDRPFPTEIGSMRINSERTAYIQQIFNSRAEESKNILLLRLFAFNLAVLGLGAAASYLFARHTLLPIEEAMEAQSRFTSDASHELRTPLAVMRTENEIALRDKNPSIGSLQAVLSSNLEEVQRLQLLTDRLLALTSQQELELEPFSLEPVLGDTLARYEAIAKQKRIALDIKPSRLQTYANPETVGDIVSILVDNALKYSPSKTKVTVNAKTRGNYIAITVADEGNGIADEDIDHIFDRFYRADPSRSKQGVEGHGLGLALAKRLAELNHATLAVANRKPHGAVFTLTLPKISGQ